MVVKYPAVALAAAVALVVLVQTAEAQWLELPTPGIPRLPDGTPNLTAPTPRTPDEKPDFSGIWRTPTGRYLRNLAADGIEVPMQPWAAQLHEERLANNGRDRPSAGCLPHSVTDFDTHVTPRKVIHTPRSARDAVRKLSLVPTDLHGWARVARRH